MRLIKNTATKADRSTDSMTHIQSNSGIPNPSHWEMTNDCQVNLSPNSNSTPVPGITHITKQD